jgi:hypothetical protein
MHLCAAGKGFSFACNAPPIGGKRMSRPPAAFLLSSGIMPVLASLTSMSARLQPRQLHAVWYGTTIGMIISNAIGIVFGVVMGKRIPERTIKWVASMIFIAFGGWGLYDTLPPAIWTPGVLAASLLVMTASIVLVHRLSARRGAQLLESGQFCEIVESSDANGASRERLVKA